MHAKYALALILVLQVSLGLCEVPQPSDELVRKYNELKTTFYRRLLTAYKRLQAEATPLMEKLGEYEGAKVTKDYLQTVEANRKIEAAFKVAAAAAEEMEPLVSKARTSVLGAYEEYLRPYIGDALSNGITNVQSVLNSLLPVE